MSESDIPAIRGSGEHEITLGHVLSEIRTQRKEASERQTSTNRHIETLYEKLNDHLVADAAVHARTVALEKFQEEHEEVHKELKAESKEERQKPLHWAIQAAIGAAISVAGTALTIGIFKIITSNLP